MRRLVMSVVIATTAACGAGTARRPVAVEPTVTPAAVEAPPATEQAEPKIVAAAFHPVDPKPSDTALTLAWETGKCQFFHSIAVDEKPDRVVVTVLERLKPDSLCPDAGMQASRTVHLEARLGTRPVYNGGASPPFRVSA